MFPTCHRTGTWIERENEYERAGQTWVPSPSLYAAAHRRGGFEPLKPLCVAVAERRQDLPDLRPNQDDVAAWQRSSPGPTRTCTESGSWDPLQGALSPGDAVWLSPREREARGSGTAPGRGTRKVIGRGRRLRGGWHDARCQRRVAAQDRERSRRLQKRGRGAGRCRYASGL